MLAQIKLNQVLPLLVGVLVADLGGFSFSHAKFLFNDCEPEIKVNLLFGRLK